MIRKEWRFGKDEDHTLMAGTALPARAADYRDIVDTAVAAGSFNTPAKALTEAGLIETLKGKGPFTVFAPTDEAFAKLPAGTLDSLLKDKEKLTAVLTYHVVPGQVAPDQLAGSHKTLQGDTIQVSGSGQDFTVNGTSSVVCGNIQTANATVYLIDQVLLPNS
jgi:uncharacterized surface protein with fasciclin (FAS1) repeats